MKDLIAKLHSNAADQIMATFSTLEMQLQGFAKSSYEKDLRIAELEAQIAGASAPVVGQHPNELRAWLSKLEDEVMPLHSDAKKLFTRVRTYLQACGYFKKPQPADTDKLRELRARIYEMKEAAYTYGDNSKEAVCAALDGVLDEIDEIASTALQAPVRQVPGWQPIENNEVSK